MHESNVRLYVANDATVTNIALCDLNRYRSQRIRITEDPELRTRQVQNPKQDNITRVIRTEVRKYIVRERKRFVHKYPIVHFYPTVLIHLGEATFTVSSKRNTAPLNHPTNQTV